LIQLKIINNEDSYHAPISDYEYGLFTNT